MQNDSSAFSFRERAAFLLMAVPLLLAAAVSYGRLPLLAHANGWCGLEAGISWCGFGIYWTLKLLCFVLFIWLFLRRKRDVSAAMPVLNLPTKPVYDPLLGLRSFAFLMVFIGHWFIVVFAPKSGLPFWLFTGSPWGGVWVFFTLSAYLMGKGFFMQRYAASTAGVLRFYRNRALRILPLYVLAQGAVGLLWMHGPLTLTPEGMFTFVSLVFSDQQEVGPISALWSISTEMQFYLLVPFLAVALAAWFKRPNAMLVAMGMIAIVSIAVKRAILLQMGYGPPWHHYVYFPLLANLDTFLIGMLTALYLGHRQKPCDMVYPWRCCWAARFTPCYPTSRCVGWW